MTKRQSFWLIIGPTVMMFAYALTSPVVHIYFIDIHAYRKLERA